MSTPTVASQSTPQAAPQSSVPENAPSLAIQRVYVKGISLEIPNAPQVFLEQGDFTLNSNVGVTVTKLEGDSTEVVLRGNVEAVRAGKHIFMLEIDQAGIFEIRNVPSDKLGQLFMVNCPTILTPYLRTQISHVLTHASLPQFMLPEMDWFSMYLQNQSQAAANDAQR
jgi:preprotein translocase subunit SecB